MIKFIQVSYKNFLSSGEQPIEIKLNRSSTTLVYGSNGAGKSQMIDAICFALFGKAFRNINKPQLPNSINQKDCVVELVFKVNKTNYKIIRGIKPNIFEIYKNDVLIDQDSKSKDYQTYLETIILKMNEKSFRQIVILGSATFKPFMQLPPTDRRQVVEDLLNISIFSEMTIVTKQKIDELRTKIDQIHQNFVITTEKMNYINSNMIQKLAAEKNSDNSALKEKITSNKTRLEIIIVEVAQMEKQKQFLMNKINELNYDFNKIEYDKAVNLQIRLKTKEEDTLKKIKFFGENQKCTLCEQSIEHSHKKILSDESEKVIENLSKAIIHYKNVELETEKILTAIKKLKQLFDEKFSEEQRISYHIQSLKNDIIADEELLVAKSIAYDTTEDQIKIEELKIQLETIETVRAELSEQLEYFQHISKMLKDDGVKGQIIKKYLPIINKTINEYLTRFGLPVKFTLDETFTEEIKARYHDSYSYYSFSEGEKKRIDLAIMFAWRKISELKNSNYTNLLFMDETFDSSLDPNATEILMSIINEISDSGKIHVFVITHASTDMLYDKFKSSIQFKKQNNFTRMI